MSARWNSDSLVVGPQPDPSRPRGAQRPPGLDPVYRWAEFTNWRGFARLARWDLLPPDQHMIQVIVQVPEDFDWTQRAAHPALFDGVAPVYGAVLPGQDWPTRHFTARLPRFGLAVLVENPLGLRWKLAMPLRNAQESAEASAKGLNGQDRDGRDMQAHNAVAAAVTTARATRVKQRSAKEKPLTSALAVIDFGCPFLHAQFRSASGTRVRALWDQGSEPGTALHVDGPQSWPWDTTDDFGYGRKICADMLDAITQAAGKADAPDESVVYRGIDHLIDYDDPRRRIWRATHGAHVLSVAAGAPDPLTGNDDCAAAANLVFVQLPSLTAMDSSGGSLAAHLLDGVRFAMSRVEHGRPLVVVISYGNCAGPHDGNSLIESALHELLKQRPDNFAIVLAGGNSRHERGHARRTVRRDRSAVLRLQLAEGDTTDSFVEVWYPNIGPALELRLRGPGRVWSEWIGQGQQQIMRAETTAQDVVVMIRHDRHVPNGDGAHVLIAFAPTAQPVGVACDLCEAGLWEAELRLANPGAGEIIFDAWIERDDPVGRASAPRTHFADQLRGDEHDTISSIANGEHTIKAFGFNIESGRPAPYSSLPKAPLLAKPEQALQVMAACENDEVNPDIAGAATRSHETYRMKGTSVAAPVLARRLYSVLCDRARVPVSRTGWGDVLGELINDEAEPMVRRLQRD